MTVILLDNEELCKKVGFWAQERRHLAVAQKLRIMLNGGVRVAIVSRGYPEAVLADPMPLDRPAPSRPCFLA